jgi:hypothetical protein
LTATGRVAVPAEGDAAHRARGWLDLYMLEQVVDLEVGVAVVVVLHHGRLPKSASGSSKRSM